jgi:hypothetical protein
MFQSLTDQQPHATNKEWMIRGAAIALISVVLFLALYFGVRSAG